MNKETLNRSSRDDEKEILCGVAPKSDVNERNLFGKVQER